MKVSAALTTYQIKKLKEDDKENKFAHLSGDANVEAEIEYDFGGDIYAAIEKFGEEVIQNLVIGHMKFTIQAKIRDFLSEGKTQAEIQEYFTTWKPGVVTRVPKIEKEKKRLLALDPDARAKEVAKLKEMLAAMEG